MRKLVFAKIRTVTNVADDTFTIHFQESKVIEENVENPVEVIDENGDPTIDENGEKVFEIKTEDKTEFLRAVSTTLPRATYYGMAQQVLVDAPSGLTRKQEDDLIAEMGIKIYITTGGFYQGQFTLADFE